MLNFLDLMRRYHKRFHMQQGGDDYYALWNLQGHQPGCQSKQGALSCEIFPRDVNWAAVTSTRANYTYNTKEMGSIHLSAAFFAKKEYLNYFQIPKVKTYVQTLLLCVNIPIKAGLPKGMLSDF